MSDDDREIDVRYTCAECGKKFCISSERKLFLVVGTQLAAETEHLYCEECNE